MQTDALALQMELRPDCRKPDELRKIALEFSSRQGVVVAHVGRTIVQAVVQESVILTAGKHSRLLQLKCDNTQDQFFIDRAVHQILPLNQLQIDQNQARQITVVLTTLSADSVAAPFYVTAAASAMLHYGLQIAFVPICVFSVRNVLDPLLEEGEITLRCAFDKGGNSYLLFGEMCDMVLHNEQARELSQMLEDCVLDDLEQRRLRRRAEYIIDK